MAHNQSSSSSLDDDLDEIDSAFQKLFSPGTPEDTYLGAAAFSPLVRLWVLRLLVTLGGQRRFVRGSDFSHDDLAIALGFAAEVNTSCDEFDAKRVNTKLARLHAKIERQAKATPPVHNPILEANLERFQTLIGLDAAERDVLRFAIVIHTEALLDEAGDTLGRLNSEFFVKILAGVLALPDATVRHATSSDSILLRCGLISIDSDNNSLRNKFDFVSRKFAGRMTHLEGEPLDLLKGIVNRCPPPDLVRSDYTHLDADISVIAAYLRSARDQHRKGVNLLLHGPPGTGKTQLARLLAQELKLELFEVSSEDNDGDPRDGANRVNAFRMTQTIFRDRPALVVFDEVEDVFGSARTPFREGRRGSEPSKAWVNRMLEHNPAPTFWITNAISEVDPAYVRRFDYVLRIGHPPREAREALLVRTCGGLLPEPTLRRLSAHPHLAPALITRAAQVLGQITGERPAEAYEGDLVRMLDHTLRAQGHAPISDVTETPLPPFYDPRFIHTSEDPEKILAGIGRTGSARLCLFGAPGTGKTAFGRYVAEKLGRRLHLVRASDILGPYVGMTEANMAEAFAQARASKSVLLIDEVDSFLQNRARAQRGWEVTAVNEMLTQMENFPGVFITSTNLMDDLDPAALRRFDLKLRFLPLRTDQAVELLALHLTSAGLAPATAEELRQLDRLSTLTPGDYAAVDRRHRFHPVADAAEFIRALSAECSQKAPATRGPIGFGVPAPTAAEPRLMPRART